jgi:hypothetical protein
MNTTRGLVVPAGGGIRQVDDAQERATVRESYHWDVVGPNPL